MDLSALVSRQGSSSESGALIHGNAQAGSFNKRSGIYTLAKGGDSTAGAVKYGDNSVSWSQGPQGKSLTNSQGVGASAGGGNYSVASTKMITNSAKPLLLGAGTSSSNALVGPDLPSMDLRNITLNNGGRIAGIRNGTEAFAVVGSSRAYKNGDDTFLVSSGTGSAGVTGNKVWVNDSQHGQAWAELCDCTSQQRGRMCYCSCHDGQSRQH